MAKSQKELIRRHLVKHGAITPIEALSLYGCFRLAARVGELREEYGKTAVVTDTRWHKCKATGNYGLHALYIRNGKRLGGAR